MVFSSSCTSNCIFIWSYLHRALSFFRNAMIFFIGKLDFFKRQATHEVRTLKSQIIKMTKKWLQLSQLPSFFLWWDIKIIFLSDVTFLSWLVTPANSFDRNNNKFNCCLEIHLESFKITFKSDSSRMPISRRDPVTPSIPIFPNIKLIKTIINLPGVSSVTEKWLQ